MSAEPSNEQSAQVAMPLDVPVVRTVAEREVA